jgi:PadR family transcriptional regulator, regulatory protein AphA
MVKLTPTARVILGFLELGARTGYDIKQFADTSTRFFWGASYGQIYPELRRLEAAGLVKATAQPRGRLSRREYTVTARGRHALHAWLADDSDLLFEYRDEALLKLFFGDLLTGEERLATFRNARRQFEEVAERFRQIEPEGDARYPALALEYGIALMDWIADWYREAERRVEGGPPHAQSSS